MTKPTSKLFKVKGSICLTLLLFVTFSCTTKKASEEVDNSVVSHFLNFTDLHFNPFNDSLLVNLLDNSRVESWDSIFNTSKKKSISNYDEETNFQLFTMALEAMQKNIENPDFIIMTGDYICHDFGEKYMHYTNKNELSEVHSFILKTISYVTAKIRSIYPNCLIIPTFGNNDSYCGDYHLQNGGEFLNDFSKLYQPILAGSLSDEEFSNLKEHGYYSIKNPNNPLHKIISFNSIFFSNKYQSDDYSWNCDCTPNDSMQEILAAEQFEWLENQLAESKSHHEKVWIITHIPAGVNVYKTISDNQDTGKNKAYLYWEKAYNQRFLSLLDSYASQVYTTMCGHTHMDEFKIHNTDSTASYIHISPSISPVFGNNPAFQIVDYSTITSSFIDFSTYYIDVDQQQQARWQKEYSFCETYPISKIDAVGYDTLLMLINSDSLQFKNYTDFYGVGSIKANSIHKDNWTWYNCGISALLPAEYENCSQN